MVVTLKLKVYLFPSLSRKINVMILNRKLKLLMEILYTVMNNKPSFSYKILNLTLIYAQSWVIIEKRPNNLISLLVYFYIKRN